MEMLVSTTSLSELVSETIVESEIDCPTRRCCLKNSAYIVCYSTWYGDLIHWGHQRHKKIANWIDGGCNL